MLIVTIIHGCKKQDEWLSIKTSKSDVAPETLTDFQAILDNTLEMNGRSFVATGLPASDNIYIPDEALPEVGELEENIYLWKDQIWLSNGSYEWNYCYQSIEFANLILDGLKSIPANNVAFDNIKGQAYFYRAAAMYNLAQVFCKPYVKISAAKDLGIPIRETSDVNIIVRQRPSLAQTYDKILSDLQMAESLLPSSQPYIQRPTAFAAKGFLAKVYLTMEDYDLAGSYAVECLKGNSRLLDFNSSIVSSTTTYPFPFNGVGNPEILFYAFASAYTSVIPEAFGFSSGVVADELYQLYEDNDLRKSTFYVSRNNIIRVLGTYTGTFKNFSGIAVNEILLIKAESEARKGNIQAAIADINQLLLNRYKTGTFTDKTAANADEALQLVLTERRKELPFTGNIRWEDLRRLNNDPRFRKTLTRTSRGQVYTLAPNDEKYVYPIPQDEITLSGIEQNPR